MEVGLNEIWRGIFVHGLGSTSGRGMMSEVRYSIGGGGGVKGEQTFSTGSKG